MRFPLKGYSMTRIILPEGTDIDSVLVETPAVSGYPGTIELREHPHAQGLFQTPCGAVIQNLEFLGTQGDMNVHRVRIDQVADGYPAPIKDEIVRMDIGPNGGIELEHS